MLDRFYTPLLAGVVVGEAAFIVLFSSGQGDFWQHYEAAREVLSQLPIRDYVYPAATSFLFVPIAFLPARFAQLAWIGISYLAFAFAFRFLPTTRRHVLVWLAWPPIFISVAAGQMLCVVLLSIGLAWSLYERKRDLEAGMVLALGLVKVHLLLPFLILGMLKARRRWLAGFLPLALLFGAVSVLLPQSYLGRMDFALSWYVQNPRSMSLLSRADQLPAMYWLVGSVVLCLVWIVLAVKSGHLAWLSMPLVQPYFLMYDLPLVAPPLAASKLVPIFYIVFGALSLYENKIPYVTFGLGALMIVECLSLLKRGA